MAEVTLAHTSDLDAGTLDAARTLLEGAFRGDFSGHDWEHALGGMHAVAWEDGVLVGHAALVQRRLLHEGRALRAGYVEGVGVRADRRRSGHGAALMEVLEEVLRSAYELGALSATEEAAAFYAERRWLRWQGPTSVLSPAGVVPTEDDDSVHVYPLGVALDLAGELTCDWRAGDVW